MADIESFLRGSTLRIPRQPLKHLNKDKFQALEKLTLWKPAFIKLDSAFIFPELKSLKVYQCSINSDWPANKFPKLQHLHLSHLFLLINDTFEDIFIEFHTI